MLNQKWINFLKDKEIEKAQVIQQLIEAAEMRGKGKKKGKKGKKGGKKK